MRSAGIVGAQCDGRSHQEANRAHSAHRKAPALDVKHLQRSGNGRCRM